MGAVYIYLHKSAIFKTIFELIVTNHKNDATHDPKIVHHFFNCGLPFWNHLFEGGGRVFLRLVSKLVFETSGGYPLGPIVASLGHPWSDVVDVLEDFRSNLALNFKDSRATNCTNHTFNKSSKEIATFLPIISSSHF